MKIRTAGLYNAESYQWQERWIYDFVAQVVNYGIPECPYCTPIALDWQNANSLKNIRVIAHILSDPHARPLDQCGTISVSVALTSSFIVSP